MSLPERSASFLLSTMLHIETELLNCGIDKDEAERISQSTVDHLRKDYGGEHIYFPKGKQLDAIFRQCELYKRWTGTNQVELAKEFDLTVPAVYRIIKKAQKQDIDERQNQLF